jgi:hypothetical protein
MEATRAQLSGDKNIRRFKPAKNAGLFVFPDKFLSRTNDKNLTLLSMRDKNMTLL